MAKAEDFLGDESAYTEIDKQTGKGVSVLAERARGWLVTINNPQKYIDVHDSKAEVYKLLQPLCDAGRISYMAGIFEQSITADENGQHTLHLHLVLYFPALARGGQLHKYLPHAALQACASNVPSVVAYIRKDPAGKWHETHPEKIAEKLPDDQAHFWEWGDSPTGNGKRQGNTAEKVDQNTLIIDAIKAGQSDAEILTKNPSTWLRPDSLRKTRYAIMSEKYRGVVRDLNVIYIEANLAPKVMSQLYPHSSDTYVVSDYTHPWEGYSAETTIVLYRYIGQFYWFDLCRYLDGVFCTLPARYADSVACYTNIIIISPLSLTDLCFCAERKGYDAQTLMSYLTHYRTYYSFDDLPEDYVRDKRTGEWRRQYLLPPHKSPVYKLPPHKEEKEEKEEREANSHE